MVEMHEIFKAVIIVRHEEKYLVSGVNTYADAKRSIRRKETAYLSAIL